MTDSFDRKVQAIIDRMDSSSRPQISEQIDTLRRDGMYSFRSLLTVVQRGSADANLGVTACWLLGRLKDMRAVDSLIAALQGSNTDIVQEAAKSLGMLKSKKAARPLIGLLLESDRAENRRTAAYALGLLRDRRGYEPLVQTLMNPQEAPNVRGHAAEALASIQNRRAASALMNALEDPSAEVRFWCAFALGRLKERRAIPALEQLVANDRSVLRGWGTIKEEAANAIVEIRRAAPPRRRHVR